MQLDPQLNLPTQSGGRWFFNPFAWQFLMVLGVACGARARDGLKTAPRAGMWTVPAVLLVLYALLVKKGRPLLFEHLDDVHIWSFFDFRQPPLISKMNLAPLRLLHFLAIAHLVALTLPKSDSVWHHPLARPLVLCGRNSLSVYCAGIVLAYFSVVAFRWVGAMPQTVAIVALDACLLQFAFAALLDRWWMKRQVRQGSSQTAAAP